ncbi:AraC family transcriptional regulator [Pedobacter sp. Bi126]
MGYDDQYYFSRLFTRYMKVSPLKYRLSRQTSSAK